MYLKSHSYGEYVFDHSWAGYFSRSGTAYYPKLQSCVPFTPASGNRLLVRPDAYGPALSKALGKGLTDIAGIAWMLLLQPMLKLESSRSICASEASLQFCFQILEAEVIRLGWI